MDWACELVGWIGRIGGNIFLVAMAARGFSVSVFVPVVNETYSLFFATDATVGDVENEIEQKMRNRVPENFSKSEFALFDSTDKLVVNASAPIPPNTLLLTLDQVNNLLQWRTRQN
mgnify:CR=1 FL=1